MATVRAVKNSQPDPKAGKPRPKSDVGFPYWDLDSAIEVARMMHERAGGICDNAQLATLLGYSGISNGSFRSRMSAAKMFGVIEDTDDRRLRVSARGIAILAPVTPADGTRARVEAFLAVDLFRRVYERFRGATLPENIGLRNLFQNEYQVVADRIAPTVRILLDSAQQAGLFDAAGNRTRMVMPLSGAPSPNPPPPRLDPPAYEPPRRRSGGDGGDGGKSEIDPAILGILQRLPREGEPFPAHRRKAVIEAFTRILAVIYPEGEDDGQ